MKVEDNQRQEGRTKHPDYALREGNGQTVMYVEAKQPSINLKDNPEPAHQVRRYGYTQSLKLSLLTDFEELCVYDTSIKVKNTDNVAVARLEYYTNNQHVERFDELYQKYSFDACANGRMAFFADNAKKGKGTATIDDDILQMIEEWRQWIATDIALNFREVDEYDLTAVVQKIIDRVIFLRICEDKDIEPNRTLQNAVREVKQQKSGIYNRLRELFDQANLKFNAGLFAPDALTDSIAVSDKVIEKIINQLYQPECQYEFSVLPVEILGTIYERFLGKIIQYDRKTKYGHKSA